MRWWRPLGALVLATALGTGLAGGPPAGAVTASEEPPPGRPAAGATGAVVTALARTGVREHWTPRRMREAVPRDLDPAGEPVTAGATLGSARSAAQASPQPRSTGKLFFREGSTDYVCSAAAVNTPERDLVVTAGHCVNTGGRRGLLGGCRAGAYYSDFLFVPAYDHAAAPYGTWVGIAAITQSAWIHQCDAVARDQAMIRVGPRGGQRLVDVVGGNALAWNYPVREEGVRVVGWPAEPPYDGQTRQECVGPTTVLPETGDAQISCPLTGGASGGPWYLRMASADTGFIFAVTSRRTTSGPPRLLATPFDSSIETLLAAARTTAAAPMRATASRPVEARPKKRRKQRLRLSATAASVGFGESFQLVARTRRVPRIVLQVRAAPGQRWQRVAKARVRGGVTVFAQAPPPGTRWYRVKVRKARKHSAPVAVTVGPCPLPPDRTPSVVAAIRCTSPIG